MCVVSHSLLLVRLVRDVLVERYYDLLVKEKENHDRLVARTQGEGGEGGGGGWLVHPPQTRHSHESRMVLTTFGQPPRSLDNDQRQQRARALLERVRRRDAGSGQEHGLGMGGYRDVWLQRSGPPGMRVLRVAPGPGSLASHRSVSMPAQSSMEEEDSNHVSLYGQPHGPVIRVTNRQGGGMGLVARRIPNDTAADLDEDDEEGGGATGEGGGRGVSGTLPVYRVISNPQHRGFGGVSGRGLMTTHSIPHIQGGGRNVESSVIMSTMPTRTTYILRTVHGDGGGRVYQPSALSVTHGYGLSSGGAGSRRGDEGDRDEGN